MDSRPPGLSVPVRSIARVAGADEFEWVPPTGAPLSRNEVIEILTALRVLADGTEPLEPNRSHILTIASVLATAMERGAEGTR